MLIVLDEKVIKDAVVKEILDSKIPYKRDANTFAQVFPQVLAIVRAIDWFSVRDVIAGAMVDMLRHIDVQAVINAAVTAAATTATKTILEKMLENDKKEQKS